MKIGSVAPGTCGQLKKPSFPFIFFVFFDPAVGLEIVAQATDREGNSNNLAEEPNF